MLSGSVSRSAIVGGVVLLVTQDGYLELGVGGKVDGRYS